MSALSPPLASRAKPPKMLSATAMARTPFAELLASARGGALMVTHKGKPAAVLMSAHRYRKIVRALAELMEEMEDREWAERARIAWAEGFVSQEEADALTREINAANKARAAKNGG